ncbi:hypothetical protein BC827DRAFT_1246133, partial [Russula dissimulans]
DDEEDDAVQESDLDELSGSSPSVPPLPPQIMPSRSSWVKTKLKLPTQTEKPSRAPRTIHKAKYLDSDIESEDDDDDPHDGDGKRPLMTRQAALASVDRSSHISLDETSRKKKQLNEAKIMLWPKRRHANKDTSEKMK